MTGCNIEYINFYEYATLPTHTLCYSVNRPWITSHLKELPNIKNKNFMSGDREDPGRMQHDLRVRKGKDSYRRKLAKNSKRVWV